MRTMDIEDLLRWAFRDELPKDGGGMGVAPGKAASAWGGVARYGELLTIVDARENRWGLVPDFGAEGRPHPDAVRIGEAVLSLDACDFGLPDDWAPLSDLGDLGTLGAAAVARAVASVTVTDRDGRRRLRNPLSVLVRRQALQRGAPVWQADVPEVRFVCGANGKPRWFRRAVVETATGPVEMEIDGMDRAARVPHADAYRVQVLDPDPADAAVARAEYEMWHAALSLLAVELDGALEAHRVTGPWRPVRPWETGDVRERRVLRDVRGA